MCLLRISANYSLLTSSYKFALGNVTSLYSWIFIILLFYILHVSIIQYFLLPFFCLLLYFLPSSLAQYELAYRENPNDYLLCLCVAVVYVNIALQKHSLNKNILVIQVQIIVLPFHLNLYILVPYLLHIW